RARKLRPAQLRRHAHGAPRRCPPPDALARTAPGAHGSATSQPAFDETSFERTLSKEFFHHYTRRHDLRHGWEATPHLHRSRHASGTCTPATPATAGNPRRTRPGHGDRTGRTRRRIA